MPGCAVAKCLSYTRKTKGTGISYYSFPKNESLRKVWTNACKRDDKFNIDNARICSKHFSDDAFARNLKSELLGIQSKKILKADAVPTKSLPLSSASQPSNSRTERLTKRQKRKYAQEILEVNSSSSNESEIAKDQLPEFETSDIFKSEICNEGDKLEDLQELQQKYNAVLKKNEELSKRVQLLIAEKSRCVRDNLIEVLSKFFTPGQIKLILSNKKRVKI